mgnify:CR=1 FL=1|jgi:hypothetical protein
MRCVLGAFLIVVIALSPEPLGAAEDTDPPFALPVTRLQQIIPNNDGMAFFYGNWDGLTSGTVREMTVSPDAFITWGGDTDPYRVLYEARNYVLVVELVRPYPEAKPEVAWTNFMVITLSHLNGDDPYSKYANMVHHHCNDPSMDDGDHAFSWSRERLIEVFKSSKCLRLIRPDDKFPFLGFPGSGARYQRRIPD